MGILGKARCLGPMVLVGLGLCVWQKNWSRWRRRMCEMEQRQKEMIELLREIRDTLKQKT